MTVKIELSQEEYKQAVSTGALQHFCEAINQKAVTKEQVRARLAEISPATVKILLGEFGVKKLSDIKPEQYEALLEKAASL